MANNQPSANYDYQVGVLFAAWLSTFVGASMSFAVGATLGCLLVGLIKFLFYRTRNAKNTRPIMRDPLHKE
jgi:hypothetical protein